MVSYPVCYLTYWNRYDLEASWDFGYVEYSTDNGVTWKSIEKYVSGTEYDWIVPRQKNAKTKCLVKVAGFNSKGISIGSDKSARFTIP